MCSENVCLALLPGLPPCVLRSSMSEYDVAKFVSEVGAFAAVGLMGFHIDDAELGKVKGAWPAIRKVAFNDFDAL